MWCVTGFFHSCWYVGMLARTFGTSHRTPVVDCARHSHSSGMPLLETMVFGTRHRAHLCTKSHSVELPESRLVRDSRWYNAIEIRYVDREIKVREIARFPADEIVVRNPPRVWYQTLSTKRAVATRRCGTRHVLLWVPLW